jgi:hypothetical protein
MKWLGEAFVGGTIVMRGMGQLGGVIGLLFSLPDAREQVPM